MPLVAGYHRPTTLSDALALLGDPTRVVLGGGTGLNADRVHSDLEAVDLQELGLDTITEPADGRVAFGSMATLDAVAAHPAAPAALARLARAELPSTLRTVATVGGVVAAPGAESVLLAALLAHDAVVTVAAADGEAKVALPELLATGVPAATIVTAVTVASDGVAADAGTARTPADTPIVAAVARRTAGGSTRLALTGVAAVPVLVDPADPTAGLAPTGDFRGSAEYRLHLARTLSTRAVEALA